VKRGTHRAGREEAVPGGFSPAQGKGMGCLEIIDVFAAGSKEKIKILELCNRVSVPQSATLMVYGNNMSNELSIHLQWMPESGAKGGKSPLGNELSRELSDFGLVTHTLWQKCEQAQAAGDALQEGKASPEQARRKGICGHLLCLLTRGRR
jgi:hypothetical protein